MLSKLSFVALAGSAVSGQQLPKKCPFGYGSEQKATTQMAELENVLYPSQILTCSKKRALRTTSFNKLDYETLATQIIDAQHDETNQSEEFHKGVYAACLLRLEGHDIMDFRKSKHSGQSVGGSDGCVNFKDADNAGLAPCLINTGISAIYEEWCDQVSVADFMVLAAEVSTASLAINHNPENYFAEGTLLSQFRDQFTWGRKTVEECPKNLGLMVNPENSCNDLQKVFIDNVYKHNFGNFKAWGLMAALSGAHTLGFAKPKNSGYSGFWGDEENASIFNNDYYRNVISHGWGPQRAVNGNEGKNQWVLIDSSSDYEKKNQMMLNTDMCLFYIDNREHAKCMKQEHKGLLRNREACKHLEGQGEILNAKNAECCAWYQFSVIEKHNIDNNEPFCGLTKQQIIELKRQGEERAIKEGVEMDVEEIFREPCCVNENKEKSFGDCDNFDGAFGPAHYHMILFAKSNEWFYKYFLEAWKIATTNGFTDLQPLE